jgi:hypothetical protein
MIVQKEEEVELCTTLLHFLQKMVTRISEHEDNKVKTIVPASTDSGQRINSRKRIRT